MRRRRSGRSDSGPCSAGPADIRTIVWYCWTSLLILRDRLLNELDRLGDVHGIDDDDLRTRRAGGEADHDDATMTQTRVDRVMAGPFRPARSPSVGLRGLIDGELQIAREIDLDAMPFTNRDGRQPVQEPAHRLAGRLRGRIADIAGDDDRAARCGCTNPPPRYCAKPEIRPTAAETPKVDA